MKNTFKLLFLCLAISSGCKKEPQDRIIEIIGLNAPYTIKIESWYTDNKNTGGSGFNGSFPANSKQTRTLSANYSYIYDITSDSANFNCQVIVDGKTVHNETGKTHHLEF